MTYTEPINKYVHIRKHKNHDLCSKMVINARMLHTNMCIYLIHLQQGSATIMN